MAATPVTRDEFSRGAARKVRFGHSAPAPQALLRELSAASNEPELPPSVQKDLSTYIHLLRSALKSGSSSRISLAVQSTFFNDSGLQPVH